MNAEQLTLHLGGRWNGRAGLARCVCHDDRQPSLSIRDGDVPGRVIFTCFAGCSREDIFAELKRRGLLEVEQRRPAVNERSSRKPDHIPDPQAVAMWQSTEPVRGSSPVGAYLTNRGISGPLPASIRSGARHQTPTMIAGVQAPDGRLIAIQTTLLTPNGRKAAVAIPRITTGALGHSAVRLAPAVDMLGLAEGVETSLSAMQLFKIPVWSALGAARMHRVEVPDGVRELHIFADNDDAGRAASERTAHAHRFRRVVIHIPLDGQKDWNDVLVSRRVAA